MYTYAKLTLCEKMARNMFRDITKIFTSRADNFW